LLTVQSSVGWKKKHRRKERVVNEMNKRCIEVDWLMERVVAVLMETVNTPETSVRFWESTSQKTVIMLANVRSRNLIQEDRSFAFFAFCPN
jgi:hypothetical protein